MLKKIFCALLLLCGGACSANRETAFVRYCPNVYMNPVADHITEMGGKVAMYKAKLIGYEGYCRNNAKTGETYAMIAPIFEVVRYSDVIGSKVFFYYYTDTSANRDKGMGRAVREFSADVPQVRQKTTVKGAFAAVRIPNNMPGYRIELGISLSPVQQNYNLKNGLSAR